MMSFTVRVLAAVAMELVFVVTVIQVAGSTTISPSYSSCPPTTLLGCNCEDESYGPVVTVSGISDDLVSCFESLSSSGSTILYKLTVADQGSIKLTESILSDVRFKSMYFELTTVSETHKNFLGVSKDFTESIEFYLCTFDEGLPKIEASALQVLKYNKVILDLNTTLPKNAFAATPEIEELVIESYYEARTLSIPFHTFRPLTKLRTVTLQLSLHLRWGSLHFAAPRLEFLHLGSSPSSIIDAGPGAFGGIPAGALVNIAGDVVGGWTPVKFFNILRGGASVKRIGILDCVCDLAWIRYSSFVDLVDLTCWGEDTSTVAFRDYDFSHCEFYENKSRKNIEL